MAEALCINMRLHCFHYLNTKTLQTVSCYLFDIVKSKDSYLRQKTINGFGPINISLLTNIQSINEG